MNPDDIKKELESLVPKSKGSEENPWTVDDSGFVDKAVKGDYVLFHYADSTDTGKISLCAVRNAFYVDMTDSIQSNPRAALNLRQDEIESLARSIAGELVTEDGVWPYIADLTAAKKFCRVIQLKLYQMYGKAIY